MSCTINVRFAPSPTGYLHVGNARIALLNWLFAKKYNGNFLLRFDDTDTSRSSQNFVDDIKKDLQWLGIGWEKEFAQSSRHDLYQQSIQHLKETGRLYPCFDTTEELSLQRKIQSSQGFAPLYDNSLSLSRSQDDIQSLVSKGLKPHWRFRLLPTSACWQDLIRKQVHFESLKVSDPVLIREDECPLYTLTSVIDDIHTNITHIIRGEDHIVNTAVQIQLFEALNNTPPTFAHVSLLMDSNGKPLSKRIDSLSLGQLRKNNIFPQALMLYLAYLGTNKAPNSSQSIQNLDVEAIVDDFNLDAFSRSTPCFDDTALASLNRAILQNSSYKEIRHLLPDGSNEKFWQTIQHNVNNSHDIDLWWANLKDEASLLPYTPENEDLVYLKRAAELLPPAEKWNAQQPDDAWNQWRETLQSQSKRKGKQLLMPLRMALTGLPKGPDLPSLLNYLGHDRTLLRLIRTIS